MGTLYVLLRALDVLLYRHSLGVTAIIITHCILHYANRQHIHITQYKIQHKMRNIDYMFTTQQ